MCLHVPMHTLNLDKVLIKQNEHGVFIVSLQILTMFIQKTAVRLIMPFLVSNIFRYSYKPH